jgi:8-oxo-dGTP pyrophosphatase MutT (NUDIX family)
MSDPAATADFTSVGFFARARERLLPAVPMPADESPGDHRLNPDFLADVTAFVDAAVLIPVVARDPEATLILTQRTANLAAHAGQISFPGGKVDAGDADPAAAAMREANEEIGLAPSSVSVVGYLAPYLSRTGFRIQPVVGRVEPGFALSVNPEEVVDAFEVPLSFLMNPANHRRGTRRFAGRDRYFYEMPFGDRYIWGVTAGILRELYEQLFA